MMNCAVLATAQLNPSASSVLEELRCTAGCDATSPLAATACCVQRVAMPAAIMAHERQARQLIGYPMFNSFDDERRPEGRRYG
ncbi:hypothetical protein D3C73_1464490 [compost metagenome]